MISLLLRLLGMGPGRVAPPTDPTDEIRQSHFWDDTKIIRAYTLMWTFRFEDVLDPDRLHAALVELFEMDSWRRLGGRLRLREDGKTEVHIPKVFSPERPAVYFTKERHAMRLRDHPLAAQLPVGGGPRVQTFPSAQHYLDLGLGPGSPRCVDDYLYTDMPLFALHVVTFDDGTLVSLNHSHAITDMGGVAAIMSAWSLVLAGHKERVPPLAGWSTDPMRAIYEPAATAEAPLEPARIRDRLLTGWRLAVFGIRFLWESNFGTYHSRLLCIPRRTMDALVAQARAQLPQTVDAPADGESKPKTLPFVSENDVLTAMLQQVYARAKPAGSRRSIVVLMAVDPRERLTGDFRPDTAYIQNAPCGVFAECVAADAQTMTLGELALRCRQTVLEQTAERQMKAMAAFAYERMLVDGNQPMFGDCLMEFTVMSNWSRGKLLDRTDFTPAIVQAGRGSVPGKPVYYHSQSIEPKGPLSMTICVVVGRDRNGDLWLRCDLKPETWKIMNEFLQKIEEE